MKKSFLTSKTLWVNVVALLAMMAQTQWGFLVDAETQVMLLGVINLALRLITGEPVGWKAEKPDSGSSLLPVLAVLLVAGFLWIQVSGCATSPRAERTAYASLVAAAGAYEFAMPLLADFYQRGILTQAQWDDAAKLGTAYAVAYHAAVEASIAYKKTHAEVDAALLNKALAASAVALARFTEYVRPLLLKGGVKF